MEKYFRITGNQLLQRRTDMVFSHIDDEVVMMSIETGEYYGLNPIASRIWEALEKPHTFDRLIDVLTLEFNIDQTACRNDVTMFLNQMTEKNLVIIK
jgi:hypothetical protein